MVGKGKKGWQQTVVFEGLKVAVKFTLSFSWSPGLELQMIPELVPYFQGAGYKLQLQGDVIRIAVQNLCEKLTHSADYCVFQGRLAVSPGRLLSWEKEK